MGDILSRGEALSFRKKVSKVQKLSTFLKTREKINAFVQLLVQTFFSTVSTEVTAHTIQIQNEHETRE